MRVTPISSNVMAQANSIDSIQANLDAIARAHNVEVEELLKSAHSAGSNGPSYLNRVLVLEARLNKLLGQK